MLGLGTAHLKGEDGINAMVEAIRIGYRMLDTALLYGNQSEVGEAIRRSGLSREELWVTTKVSFFPQGDDSLWMYNENNLVGNEASSIDTCLDLLHMTYVDLCLLHNPCVTPIEYNVASLPHFFELFSHTGSANAIRPEKLHDGTLLRDFILKNKLREIDNVDVEATFQSRKESWLEMERQLATGKCKHIGVSNYPSELLLEMKSYATVMPEFNQVEYHPRFASPDLLKVCRDLNIVLIGYGTGHFVAIERSIEKKTSKKNSILDSICNRTGKSMMQVVLRWMLQHGVVSIPRSQNFRHILHNRDIFNFELTSGEMESIDSLNEDYPYYWDPNPTRRTLRKN